MKVLVWMNISFDDHSTSGHLLQAIIKALCLQGNTVKVIQKKTGGSLPILPIELEKLGVTTEYIDFIQPPKTNFAARYLAELKYILKSKKLIKDKYDAYFIQSNMTAGFSVSIIRKLDKDAHIVYNVQDIYPQNVYYAHKIDSRNIKYKLMYAVQRYAYSKSDSIITISEDMKALLINECVDESKIKVIYNWSYRDEIYDKRDILDEIEKLFSKNYFNVVYAGNIGLFQNVGIILDVAKKLKNYKDIKFHIFGRGIQKDELIKRYEHMKIENIVFHDIVPHKLAPSLYASADVNLITLYKNIYKTALPSKIATCLACQKPIIFAIGCESEFGKKVNMETGCPLIDTDDVSGIVNALLSIKENKTKCNTKDFFEKNCSISKNSKAYAQIITKKYKK